ncbi:MAG TPA: metallophosphoesterase [Capillimicrobium sp.]
MIVQLSDLHLGAPGELSDPLEDAARAFAAVRRLRPRPDAVIVTGDLAEHAAPAEYAHARRLADELGLPVHVIPGNHDRRAAMRASLGLPGAPEDPVRFDVRAGALRVIGCDTLVEGRDEGRLGREGLAWLGARLAEGGDTPTIVALHQPPVLVGMPFADEIALVADDRAALADLLAAHPAVRLVTAGHAHLAVRSALGGTPAMVGPSTWRAAPVLALGDAGVELRAQPAGMLVHALVADELVSHVQPLG